MGTDLKGPVDLIGLPHQSGHLCDCKFAGQWSRGMIQMRRVLEQSHMYGLELRRAKVVGHVHDIPRSTPHTGAKALRIRPCAHNVQQKRDGKFSFHEAAVLRVSAEPGYSMDLGAGRCLLCYSAERVLCGCVGKINDLAAVETGRRSHDRRPASCIVRVNRSLGVKRPRRTLTEEDLSDR